MGVADWRAWTDQSGGTLPTAPNPPGTPWQINQMFPGINPIGVGATPGPPGSSDLIDGQQSFPKYANAPVTINAVDPFYVGSYPTGGGWVAQMERFIVPSPGTAGTQTVAAWPAGVPGASVPAGALMRPVVPGITS